MKDRELVSDPTNWPARNGQNTKSFNLTGLLTTACDWHGPFTPAHGVSQNRPRESLLKSDILFYNRVDTRHTAYSTQHTVFFTAVSSVSARQSQGRRCLPSSAGNLLASSSSSGNVHDAQCALRVRHDPARFLATIASETSSTCESDVVFSLQLRGTNEMRETWPGCGRQSRRPRPGVLG